MQMRHTNFIPRNKARKQKCNRSSNR